MFKLFRKRHRSTSKCPKPHIVDNGCNNHILIGTGFDVSKINITILGDNNTVNLCDTKHGNKGPIHLIIHANNSSVFIDSDSYIDALGLEIELGNMVFEAIDNSSVTIGSRTSIGGCGIVIYNSNANVKIGSDVMMAYAIRLYNTDAHPIYAKNTDGEYQIVNRVTDINIGNNCWIGAYATILKNVSLADGTIVGYGSIVSKSFNEPNIALAGNPARKVKSDLKWKLYDTEYIKNVHD